MTLAPVYNGRPLVSIRRVRGSVLTGGKSRQVLGKPAPWAENPGRLTDNQKVIIKSTKMIAALVKAVVPSGERRLEAVKEIRESTKNIKEKNNPAYMYEVFELAIDYLKDKYPEEYDDAKNDIKRIQRTFGALPPKKATAKAEEE